MVQRMPTPSGEEVAKRMLNNLVALHKAMSDADDTLSQNLQREDLKQLFSQFKSLDQMVLANYYQVSQLLGAGQGSQDKNTQGLINECTQAISSGSNSDIEKIGWYNVLVFAANQGNNVLAQYGIAKTNETVSRLMSQCFVVDTNRTAMIGDEMVREIGRVA